MRSVSGESQIPKRVSRVIKNAFSHCTSLEIVELSTRKSLGAIRGAALDLSLRYSTMKLESLKPRVCHGCGTNSTILGNLDRNFIERRCKKVLPKPTHF